MGAWQVFISSSPKDFRRFRSVHQSSSALLCSLPNFNLQIRQTFEGETAHVSGAAHPQFCHSSSKIPVDLYFPKGQAWVFSLQLLPHWRVPSPGEGAEGGPASVPHSLWGFHAFAVLFQTPWQGLRFLSTVNMKEILLDLSETFSLSLWTSVHLPFGHCLAGKPAVV